MSATPAPKIPNEPEMRQAQIPCKKLTVGGCSGTMPLGSWRTLARLRGGATPACTAITRPMRCGAVMQVLAGVIRRAGKSTSRAVSEVDGDVVLVQQSPCDVREVAVLSRPLCAEVPHQHCPLRIEARAAAENGVVTIPAEFVGRASLAAVRHALGRRWTDVAL